VNAREFFTAVVVENYRASKAAPASFAALWNAIVSMNTVAEYVALDRLGYARLTRNDIDRAAETVRAQYSELRDIKICAETLKHVRKHLGQQVIATSTGVDTGDPTTWELQDGSKLHDLRATLERAYVVVSTMPEIK
jgi:hypothetical protein